MSDSGRQILESVLASQYGGADPLDIADSLAIENLNGARSALDELSGRELEVLRLVLTGSSAADIANALNLSVKTVRNLHYAVKRKLGARNDIELVRYCAELGLVV